MSTALNEVVFIVSAGALSYAFLRCLRDWLKHNIKEFRWWLCFLYFAGCYPSAIRQMKKSLEIDQTFNRSQI